MEITKKLRFEIFKRDGFACQYCGRRPPDVVLELDHIDPKANGGTNLEINLITSCFDCNRGKGARRLGEVHPRPDADVAYLQVQQEIAEAKRYLDASRVREKIMADVTDRLQDLWCETYESEYVPVDQQWVSWLNTFSAEEIERAIRIAAKLKNRKPHTETYQLIKYVSGVLWRRREQADA